MTSTRFRIPALLASIAMLSAAVIAADRPLILVTPAGVWQSTPTNGIPGQWRALEADVVIQGFGDGGGNTGGGGGETPDPPADAVVAAITAAARQHLKTSQEAASVAALVRSVGSRAKDSAEFSGALTRAAGIADGFLGAKGRVEAFVEAALRITTDAAKMTAGVERAFGLSATDLDAVSVAVTTGNQAALPPAVQSANAEKAIDFATIMMLIEMVLDLLERLGWFNR